MKPTATIDQIVAQLRTIRDRTPDDESVWVYMEPDAEDPGFRITVDMSGEDLGVELYGDDDNKMLVEVARLVLDYATEEDDGR